MKRLPEHISLISWLGKGLAELFFRSGELCPICTQEQSMHHGLGKNCLRKVMFIHAPFCTKCGKPLRLQAQGRELCETCRLTVFYFRQARAVALYEGALREYLAEVKYRYRPELGTALGELLVEWLKASPQFRRNDLVIPIPIHPQKLTQRGYNQAELLALPLKQYLGMKVKSDVLIRVKLTETQNALKKSERFLNVQEAFQVNDTLSVGGRKILLIDDIMTTGATVSEAARILLAAGALSVDVLTLATGVIENEWLLQT